MDKEIIIYNGSILSIVGGKRKQQKRSKSSSNSSRISTKHVQSIIEKLMCQTRRSSTNKNYLQIWRQFNKFVINLDVKPPTWEDRVTLFIGYKIENGMQSSTVKCYVTAIKKLLVDDGYKWNDQKVLLGSLTRACRLINDKVYTRLPIQCGLLELIIFEVQRIYATQPYLEIVYKALFSLSYYGLMRVCEVTEVPDCDHVLKANNIHSATNKDKLLLYLYTSKTHSTANRPQKIKITSNFIEKSGFYARRNFCPFELVNDYIELRVACLSDLFDDKQFFVFKDGSPIKADSARALLNKCLTNLGLNSDYYGMHSFRIGRTTDLLRYNYSIEEVKCMGRWKSNTIYRYVRL